MKRRLSLVFGLLALALVAGGSSAYAQEDTVVGNIPFKFIAAGRVHDPGRYELTVGADEGTITLIPESAKKAENVMLVETRLAAPASWQDDGRLVFDRVGDTYYLSEAWFPGLDGFVVHLTKAMHAHETVVVSRKSKDKK